jgi:hypothetical protein
MILQAEKKFTPGRLQQVKGACEEEGIPAEVYL